MTRIELTVVVGALAAGTAAFASRPPTAGPLILVGESRLTRERGIGASDLPPEGFRVRTFTNGLAIVGWLPPGERDPGRMGTLWGVYDVLERYLGIRWYHPGADGTIVPSVRDLIVEPVHYTDFPVRIKRHAWPRGGERQNRVGVVCQFHAFALRERVGTPALEHAGQAVQS